MRPFARALTRAANSANVFMALELALWGTLPEALAFLTPPHPGAYAEAPTVFRMLGALADMPDRFPRWMHQKGGCMRAARIANRGATRLRLMRRATDSMHVVDILPPASCRAIWQKALAEGATGADVLDKLGRAERTSLMRDAARPDNQAASRA